MNMSGFNWQRLLPFAIMAIIVACWVTRADLVSKLQQKGQGEMNYEKPIFIAWVTFSSYCLFLPIFYFLKHLHEKKEQRRLLKRGLRSDESNEEGESEGAEGSYASAYERPQHSKASGSVNDDTVDVDVEGGLQESSSSVFPALRDHLKPGALLSTFFFVCVFTYTTSLSETTVSVNTVIYNSQCVVVFFISVALLRERVNAKKLLSVLVSLGGVVLVAVFSQDDGDDDEANKDKVKTTAFGIMAVVISMLTYAIYQVMYKLVTEPPANPTSLGMCLLRLSLPASSRSGLFRLLRSPSSLHHAASTAANTSDEHDGFGYNGKDGQAQRSVNLTSPLRESYGGVDGADGDGDGVDGADEASPISAGAKSLTRSPSSSSSSAPSHSSEFENTLSILYMGIFGTMGLVAYWPIIVVCHYSGYETVELPTGHVAFVFAATVVLDAIMNVAILICISLSSPLFVTCGTLLTIPVSVVADLLINDYSMAWPCYVGVGLIIGGFFGLTFSKEPGEVVIG